MERVTSVRTASCHNLRRRLSLFRNRGRSAARTATDAAGRRAGATNKFHQCFMFESVGFDLLRTLHRTEVRYLLDGAFHSSRVYHGRGYDSEGAEMSKKRTRPRRVPKGTLVAPGIHRYSAPTLKLYWSPARKRYELTKSAKRRDRDITQVKRNPRGNYTTAEKKSIRRHSRKAVKRMTHSVRKMVATAGR